jgi:hypothetical protein
MFWLAPAISNPKYATGETSQNLVLRAKNPPTGCNLGPKLFPLSATISIQRTAK